MVHERLAFLTPDSRTPPPPLREGTPGSQTTRARRFRTPVDPAVYWHDIIRIVDQRGRDRDRLVYAGPACERRTISNTRPAEEEGQSAHVRRRAPNHRRPCEKSVPMTSHRSPRSNPKWSAHRTMSRPAVRTSETDAGTGPACPGSPAPPLRTIASALRNSPGRSWLSTAEGRPQTPATPSGPPVIPRWRYE